MKAVGYKKPLPIESADALIDFETAKPEPKGRDVRVAVKAISANPVDYKVRKRAAPAEGETKILGYDAAGIVDAVGGDVTLFEPGDEVFYAGRSSARAPIRNFIWSTSASSAASQNRCRLRKPPPCP
jgi:NADPH:quinone reductase-like Zn-dependent oxidoreductase